MMSFDPVSSWAEFDYWDRLTGDAAVAWLVANEGMTESAARAIVDDFADSEFITKNTNPQLRTFDLSVWPVKLLPYPFGYEYAPNPDPVLTSFADLCTLYATHPDILLTKNYYYITVKSNGDIIVEMRYQP